MLASPSELEGRRMTDMTNCIIAGHPFGSEVVARWRVGPCQMAAATDHCFDFGHVMAFDPAVQYVFCVCLSLRTWDNRYLILPGIRDWR